MRALALCLLLIIVPGGAQAAQSSARVNPWQSDQAAPQLTPDQIVRQGIDRLTGFMLGPGARSPELVRRFLERYIAPYFDFHYMARWAAGRYYRRMDKQQDARLTARLREMFLGALARNLGAYAQPLPQVVVYPARAGQSPYETVVPARVELPMGTGIRLDFRCYYGPHGWRIFDVSADGASAVMFYRQYFTAMLRRYGMDALLH